MITWNAPICSGYVYVYANETCSLFIVVVPATSNQNL